MSKSIMPIAPLHAVGDLINENYVLSFLILVVVIAQIAEVYFLILPTVLNPSQPTFQKSVRTNHVLEPKHSIETPAIVA